MTKLAKNALATLNNGHKIPISGFGLYETPVDKATELTYEALKVGYRHIDSARAYGNEAEAAKGIAKFLKEYADVKRSDIFFTTKINNKTPIDSKEAKRQIQESYDRVKDYIEYIDLFLIHSPLPDKETRFIVYEALQDAHESGITKSIGVSNYGAKHLDELFAWDKLKVKPVVNQVELHPWLPRKDLQTYAKKYDHLLEAYAPITRGQKFDEPDLQAIVEKYNGKYTPAQILLRWSYQQGFVVLAKTATVSRIKPNFTVLDDVELDVHDYQLLEKPDSYDVLCWDPTVAP